MYTREEIIEAILQEFKNKSLKPLTVYRDSAFPWASRARHLAGDAAVNTVRSVAGAGHIAKRLVNTAAEKSLRGSMRMTDALTKSRKMKMPKIKLRK